MNIVLPEFVCNFGGSVLVRDGWLYFKMEYILWGQLATFKHTSSSTDSLCDHS